MAKRSTHRKNARLALAGLPPIEEKPEPLQSSLPLDPEKMALDFMVSIHAAGPDHPLFHKLPAGWSPPMAICQSCYSTGPLHTADRVDGHWVCPGCGSPVITEAPVPPVIHPKPEGLNCP